MIYESNPWMYQGKPFLEIPEKAFSFVYILRHEASGKAYIGKKLFWFSKTKQVKGKKKRVKAESDWREYFSSSEEIQKMVAEGEHFSREILHICESKGVANYLEAREQMDARVLEYPDKWFNGIINCRVAKSHIKALHR
jgi:hypothetical protein